MLFVNFFHFANILVWILVGINSLASCAFEGTIVDNPVCKDMVKDCIPWARRGECTKNPDYMFVHCKSACHACGSCKDGNFNCRRWAKTGECDRNPTFMIPFCPMACGLC